MKNPFWEVSDKERAASGVLGRILKEKRSEVEELKSRHDLQSLRQEAREALPPLDLIAALRSCSTGIPA